MTCKINIKMYLFIINELERKLIRENRKKPVPGIDSGILGLTSSDPEIPGLRKWSGFGTSN